MKILVVEDEPGVRAYTTATLTNSGDEVESASDGDEAFFIVDADPTILC